MNNTTGAFSIHDVYDRSVEIKHWAIKVNKTLKERVRIVYSARIRLRQCVPCYCEQRVKKLEYF